MRGPQSVLMIAFCAGTLLAHPMGNFSISHYAGIHVERDAVEVRYIIDMAEIPTFQELQQSTLTARQDEPGLEPYLTARAASLAKGLAIALNGQALALKAVSHDVLFSLGAGNLSTMKLGFVYRAALPDASGNAGTHLLSYQDSNFAGRAGWKEIVISVGPGVRLAEGFVLRPDRSSMLSNYPTDPLDNPPQDLSASIAFRVIAPPVRTSRAPRPISTPSHHEEPARMQTGARNVERIELQPNQQATPRNAFTQLMAGKQIGLGIMLIGALIAAGLGALHALEPGHGKTIVAAYLVGSKGTARHAFLLGLIVTIAHTAGVYLLGGVTLFAQKYIMPDRLYPFLSVMSGILIAGMGIYILLTRGAGLDLSHSHGAGGHSHGMFLSSRPDKKIGGRELAALGITGGIVPCPAALVVLLSAVTVHRVAFGLFLIFAFSLGLAVVLIGMGLAAVYAGKLMSRFRTDGPLIQRWLPVASAAMITIVGCVVAIQGLMAAGIVQIRI